MKQITTTVLLIASLTFALSAQPGQGKGQGRGGYGEPGARIAQELNLTEKQQQDLKELRDAHRELQKPAREEMRTVHQELNQLLKAEKVDTRAVKATIKKGADLTSQKLQQHVDYQLKVKEIMTPEQFAKYLDLREERMENRRGMHQGKGKGNSHKGKGKPNRSCN